MTRDELIAALEKAEEGDRTLDESIAIAIDLWRPWLSKHRYWIFNGSDDKRFHWPSDPIPDFDSETGKKIELTETPWHGWGWEADVPPFTASIDAALMLVPEDHDWIIYNVNGHVGGTPSARIGMSEAYGFTPALSLCIAALKARGE
jgi:hypothetical protein